LITKPETTESATITVVLVKPLADGAVIPGIKADGSASEVDRVYAAPYLKAGLIKEFVATEAPRVAKAASEVEE
jgi:hypothetical protein